MEGKSSTSRDALFMFTFQLSGHNHHRAILKLKFFITNYSNFVVERNSNTNISHIGSEFWFFAEKLGFLEKKHDIFFKIDTGGKFAVDLVQNDIIS